MKAQKRLPECPPSGPQILHPPRLTKNTTSSCPLVNIYLLISATVRLLMLECNFLCVIFATDVCFCEFRICPLRRSFGWPGREEVKWGRVLCGVTRQSAQWLKCQPHFGIWERWWIVCRRYRIEILANVGWNIRKCVDFHVWKAIRWRLWSGVWRD